MAEDQKPLFAHQEPLPTGPPTGPPAAPPAAPPAPVPEPVTEHDILNDPKLAPADFARARSDPGFMAELIAKRSEEKPPVTPAPVSTEPKPDEGDGEGAEPAGARRKGRGGYKRTAERLQEEVDNLAAENAALKTRGAATPPTPPTADPFAAVAKNKPKEEDFEGHVEYLEALMDYKSEQKVEAMLAADRRARAAASEQASRRQQVVQDEQSLQQQVAAAKKSHADYDQVVDKIEAIQWSDQHVAALGMTGHAGEIAYYLGSRADEAEDLSRLGHPAAILLAMGKILTKIEAGNGHQPADPPPADPTPPPPPVAKLPPPMKGITGASAPPVKDADYWATKASPQEYAEARRAGKI